MPPSVVAQLRQLGDNLAVARKRRREPLKVWAQRIGVSEPTLVRMEKGDPSVAFGIYATALWLIGRAQAERGKRTMNAADLAAYQPSDTLAEQIDRPFLRDQRGAYR